MRAETKVICVLGGEPADQVHGAGRGRDGVAAFGRDQDQVLPSAQLQVPVRPVGAAVVYGLPAAGVPLLHADLCASRELPVVPHQGSGSLDLEAEELLRPVQLQPRGGPSQGDESVPEFRRPPKRGVRY